MGKFNDFTQSKSDSVNLSKIGDTPFTITNVEKSDYTDKNGNVSPGVVITTMETFTRESDGEKVNKLHTTRRAIVNKLLNPRFIEALEEGETFKVKCPNQKVPGKNGGMAYFTLEEA